MSDNNRSLQARRLFQPLTVHNIWVYLDEKFAPAFDKALQRKRGTVIKTPVCAPNCQAFVERFIGSLRAECLNHFVFLGLKHLDSVIRTYRGFYLECRPHQGKENELLMATKPKNGRVAQREHQPETISLAEVQCEQRLGGLLKHYSRKAA